MLAPALQPLHQPQPHRQALCNSCGCLATPLPPASAPTCLPALPLAAAAILGAGLYFWQMPHFMALAWMCKADYTGARRWGQLPLACWCFSLFSTGSLAALSAFSRCPHSCAHSRPRPPPCLPSPAAGGYRMLSMIDATGRRTAACALRNCLYLFPLGALATWLGVTSPYFAYKSGAWQLQLWGLAERSSACSLHGLAWDLHAGPCCSWLMHLRPPAPPPSRSLHHRRHDAHRGALLLHAHGGQRAHPVPRLAAAPPPLHGCLPGAPPAQPRRGQGRAAGAPFDQGRLEAERVWGGGRLQLQLRMSNLPQRD